MPKYTVYVEFYGKKLAIKNIDAKTEYEARREVMNRVNILKVDKEFGIEDLLDGFSHKSK